MFDIESYPEALNLAENAAFLGGIIRGIERETLRCNQNGSIAQTPHPTKLGSALTHPQITTDFSEALLEFITPPSHNTDVLFNSLTDIHTFAIKHIDKTECLWPLSMPCLLPNDNEIPIADYGRSHNGRMKKIYREGLSNRYGRKMQTVSGLHYNFSLPNAFWAHLLNKENATCTLQEFKDQKYFALIRNLRRYYWLLIYLFGASPAIDQSFIEGRVVDKNTPLQALNNHKTILYAPYATSLRMGNLGYQSTAQQALDICYNQKNTYIDTLCEAIKTPYQHYQKIGIKNAEGHYLQLNTGLLQIENEFYSAVRPKRTANPGETALSALCSRGTEYIEVRCIDINPLSPVGITPEQTAFLDTFMVYCALKDSALCDTEESYRISHNQEEVVIRGRQPGLTLLDDNNQSIALKEWATQLIDAMRPVAESLDKCHHNTDYTSSLEDQLAIAINPELTPSAMQVETLSSYNSFIDLGLEKAEQHLQHLREKNPLNPRLIEKFTHISAESVEKFHHIERTTQTDDAAFDEFLNNYYNQYALCSN